MDSVWSASWPGITDYMQKDCQRIYAHPSWKGRNLRSLSGAWQFDYEKLYNLKRTFRRSSCLLMRLLGNMGAAGETPLLERFGNGVEASGTEKRCLEGLYLDVPQEWDDPYRFFRW